MAAVVSNSTHVFRLVAKKDGAVWDLTDAVVLLYFRKYDPSSTLLTKTATVTSAAAGIAEFTCSTTDIILAGKWTRTWQITQGAVVQRSEPIWFDVVLAP